MKIFHFTHNLKKNQPKNSIEINHLIFEKVKLIIFLHFFKKKNPENILKNPDFNSRIKILIRSLKF